MPLLMKCNVTNMSFPCCTSDDQRAVGVLVVPTRRQNAMNAKNVKCQETGKVFSYITSYSSAPNSMSEYTPIGIVFKGDLDEWGQLAVDFEDQDNVRNLRYFLQIMTIDYVEPTSRDFYDVLECNKLFMHGKYSECWEQISPLLRFFNGDSILYNRLGEIVPVYMSLIRGDAYDMLMSIKFQREINKELPLLAERQKMTPLIIETLKTAINEKEGVYSLNQILRELDYFIQTKTPKEMHVFTNYHHLTNTILKYALEKDIRLAKDDEERLAQVLSDAMYIEYLVECFEHLEIQFLRGQSVSSEDYCNTNTYNHLKHITALYEADQLRYDFDDGYPYLMEQISTFSDNEVRYHATYIEENDDAIDDMLKKFGYFDIGFLETDCNMVLVYDTKDKKYFTIEDHELVEKFRRVIV